MPSKRALLKAYTSDSVFNCLKKFQEEYELKSLSQAVHRALEDYFEVGIKSRADPTFSVEKLNHEIADLKKQVRKIQAEKSSTVETVQVQKPGGLSQAALSDILKVSPATVAKHKRKPGFPKWSKTLDPNGQSWTFSPKTQRFLPANETGTEA